MRMALKHQIILTPAVVLLLLTLLLGFLQYTYWDLSVKRQEATNLKTVFIALAEADMALQRIHVLTVRQGEPLIPDSQMIGELEELHLHLDEAVHRIIALTPVERKAKTVLEKAVIDLDPRNGYDLERFRTAINALRPQLTLLAETTQKQREGIRQVHTQDIDTLVERTTFVTIIVLGMTILLGIALSLAFARRILRRIQDISENAGRIVQGDLTPLSPPETIHDELDDLTLSINRMTDQLIRVVSTEKILEGAEEERRRIAMDLHDQTLADLSSVLRGLRKLKGSDECCGDASALEEELQRAMTNLRGVMENLHPQTLDILGLGAALQSYIERNLAKENLPEYYFHMPEGVDSLLNRIQSLSLYRIAVEAIQNVIKHSKATRYEVCLDRLADAVLLSVEDNGTGFDVNTLGPGRGRGVSNMTERARSIGAVVRWTPSRFTSGTRFELTLPIRTPSKD